MTEVDFEAMHRYMKHCFLAEAPEASCKSVTSKTLAEHKQVPVPAPSTMKILVRLS